MWHFCLAALFYGTSAFMRQTTFVFIKIRKIMAFIFIKYILFKTFLGKKKRQKLISFKQMHCISERLMLKFLSSINSLFSGSIIWSSMCTCVCLSVCVVWHQLWLCSLRKSLRIFRLIIIHWPSVSVSFAADPALAFLNSLCHPLSGKKKRGKCHCYIKIQPI